MIGEFQSTDLLSDCTRKSAFFMAEEFTLQQTGGNRSGQKLPARASLISSGVGSDFFVNKAFATMMMPGCRSRTGRRIRR
jgi:hypothetical protein